jgi:hypothetical protein
MRKLKIFLLTLLKPIQRLMQKIGRGEPLMNRKSVDLAISMIKEGDILLSYEKQRITSAFIKGKYKHAAIVSPKIDVIEAVGTGVRDVDLEEWLFLMDYVAIIRPEFDNHTINYLAACNALSYIGKPYDYTFSSNNDAIYCSELVFLCYQKELKEFLNQYERSEILPQLFRDLADRPDSKFKLIYEFQG